jgi:hypothetical protein
MTLAAALVATTGIAAALLLRPEIAISRAEIAGPDSASSRGEVFWSSAEVFADLPSDVRLLREGETLALEIDPRGELLAPDVLVYWAPGEDLKSELPESARLLGRLAGSQARRFTIAPPGPGSLYLYSLGHHELLARGALPGPEGAQ